MRVYAADAVHAALPWPALIEALHTAFTARGDGAARVPQRHAHNLGGADTLLLMPAWDSSLLVTKLVTVMPGAPHAVPPASTVQASVLVLSRRNGQLLALMDGEALTLRRTAATSALAARHLARHDAASLLLVGTGRLAAWMGRAHAALRPDLSRVAVWGRHPDAARALARMLSEEGLPATAVGDLQAAVQAADIVCCATTSGQPLVLGQWLQPGTHLDLVGSFRADMCEADAAAVQRARVVVDTNAARSEAGELAQALAQGAIAPSHVLGSLGDVLNGMADGSLTARRDAADITLFKSVGSALADLAAVHCVLQADARMRR